MINTLMNGVKWEKNLVPPAKYPIKAPYTMTPKKITIHNTDNSAPASNEVRYMISNNNQVSYHIAVDEDRAVQGIPFNRSAWHAGDGKNGYGNRHTIGVEMCRSYDRARGTTNLNEPLRSQFNRTFINTVKVVAFLCHMYGIRPSHTTIKRHRDWSGKYCPRKIMNDGTWNRLVNEIIQEYNKGAQVGNQVTPTPPRPSVPANKLSVGSSVTVSPKATTYATGQTMASFVKGGTYTIGQVKPDRVLLKGINSWVRITDLSGFESGGTPSQSVIKVGSRVKIKPSATHYVTGQVIPNWVKGNTYPVIQQKGDRSLLGTISSWVYTRDLTL